MKTKTYKIKGLDCESCAKMIELDFEDKGIEVSCDFTKEQLSVDSSIPKDKIKEILESSGYNVKE